MISTTGRLGGLVAMGTASGGQLRARVNHPFPLRLRFVANVCPLPPDGQGVCCLGVLQSSTAANLFLTAVGALLCFHANLRALIVAIFTINVCAQLKSRGSFGSSVSHRLLAGMHTILVLES